MTLFCKEQPYGINTNLVLLQLSSLKTLLCEFVVFLIKKEKILTLTNFTTHFSFFLPVISPPPIISILQLSDRRESLNGNGQTDGWKATGKGKGSRERRRTGRGMTHFAGAWSIYGRNCPIWWTAGRATALHWYPSPCPSSPKSFHLFVFAFLFNPFYLLIFLKKFLPFWCGLCPSSSSCF